MFYEFSSHLRNASDKNLVGWAKPHPTLIYGGINLDFFIYCECKYGIIHI